MLLQRRVRVMHVERPMTPGQQGRRLHMALAAAGLTRQAFAKQLNKSKSTVDKWISGEHRCNILAEVSDILGIRQEWLISGLDPMTSNDPMDMAYYLMKNTLSDFEGCHFEIDNDGFQLTGPLKPRKKRPEQAGDKNEATPDQCTVDDE